MVPLPNVPTDSLYKFQALGGIIALLTTVILFLTEVRNSAKESTQLKKNMEIYKLGIEASKARKREIESEFRADRLAFIKYVNKIDKDEKAAIKSKLVYTYIINEKKYSHGEYIKYVYNKYNKYI